MRHSMHGRRSARGTRLEDGGVVGCHGAVEELQGLDLQVRPAAALVLRAKLNGRRVHYRVNFNCISTGR